MDLWTVLLYAAVLIVGLLSWAIVHWLRRRSMYPGPASLPVVGNTLRILELSRSEDSSLYHWSVELAREYGNMFMLDVPMAPVLALVVDPESVTHFLHTNFDNYEKGAWFRGSLAPFLGHGIFNADGDQWRRQRKIAAHLFKVRELRYMTEVFSQHGSDLATVFGEHADSGEVVDVQDMFQRFTLDSFCEIAFGVDIDALHTDPPFGAAFNSVVAASFRRMIIPLWRLLGPLARVLPSDRKLRADIAVLDELIYSLVDERTEQLAGTEQDGAGALTSERRDLISRFVAARDEHDQPLYSREDLRDVTLNFIIAGRDTTAALLTWTLHLLSENRHERERLEQLVDEQFATAEPDYDSVRSIPLLEGIINEALRLFPPVPLDGKVAIGDDTLPNGNFVPRGTLLGWSPFVMGRLERFWDEPMSFRPDRWLGPEHNGGLPVPKTNKAPFSPFQPGPRQCLGMNMAYLEAKLLIVTLVKRFQFDMVPNHPVQLEPALTICSRHGMRMTVKRRV